MSLIEMRSSTRATKGDHREYWKEQIAEGLIAMCIAFICEVLLAVPTLAFSSWKIFGVVVIMFVAIVMAACRVAYCIYKYWCTLKPCRKT